MSANIQGLSKTIIGYNSNLKYVGGNSINTRSAKRKKQHRFELVKNN